MLRHPPALGIAGTPATPFAPIDAWVVPSPPAPLPQKERGVALTPGPSPIRGEGSAAGFDKCFDKLSTLLNPAGFGTLRYSTRAFPVGRVGRQPVPRPYDAGFNKRFDKLSTLLNPAGFDRRFDKLSTLLNPTGFDKCFDKLSTLLNPTGFDRLNPTGFGTLAGARTSTRNFPRRARGVCPQPGRLPA
ncbi:MAG: hypothetical protein DDG59_03815 [Anaerolineae bacterium]|nr:MAG: hypothetical protein DDG59_03815 [Anaerolineae bacterium]